MGVVDADADEIAAIVREVLQRQAARPALTVAQLYAKYEASQQDRKSWWAARDKTIKFVDAHADRDALSLTITDWTTHALARIQTKVPRKAQRCYSKATVNVELGAVKTFLNWCVEQGLIRYNPIAKAKIMKNRRGRDTAPKEWEIGRCLSACQTPQQTVMVLCAADAGMRRSEIRLLQHDWVDHEQKTITLPNWACKCARGGTVPATRRLLDAIAALPRHIRAPQVLVSEHSGGPYAPITLNVWWREIRERAGVAAAPGDGSVHLHDLRAAAATNALDRGVRLETVSLRYLRHSNLATTQIYLRGRDVGNLDQAREAMEAGIIRDQQTRKGPKRAAVDFDAPVLPEHLPNRSDT